MPPRALTLREGKAPVRDRLLTMLFLAALLHGLIILGLTFNSSASGGESAPGLQVLLVSDEVPEAERNDSATYLAQRTQLGSGNTRDSLTRQGDLAGNRADQVITTTGWNTQVHYLADAGDSGSSADKPLLLEEQN